MKFSKICSLGLLFCLTSIGSVNAASVRANITGSQTSAKSSNIYMSKNTGFSMYGKNNKNTFNRPFIITCFKSVAGVDPTNGAVSIKDGTSYTYNSNALTNGNYYVHIDPMGPFAAGTVGYATLTSK